MYASFAKNSPSPVGADLLSLSWKGDARRGWLVSGNSRKTVGVTYTQLTDDDEFECDLFESTAEQSEISLERQANRRNFNFREHAHEVRGVCVTVRCGRTALIHVLLWHKDAGWCECERT